MSDAIMHSVSFWSGEVCIWNFWTANPPNYKEGQTVYLSVTNTPKGMDKFPEFKVGNTRGIIKEIVHSVDITVSDDISFFHRLEIYLVDE